MGGINWAGLTQRGNPFADFSEGLQQGAELRRQRDRDNLFAQEQRYKIEERRRELAQDQENRLEQGIVSHMAKSDPAAAQRKAVEVGQYDLAAQIGKLDESQRKAAREKAEDLGGFAVSLKRVPYEQRRPIIEQARDTLVSYGFTPDQLAKFDPSDAALDAQIASATDLKTALEEQNRQRDDARASAQAEEVRRHNRVTEGQGAARVSIAKDTNARGWAAHNERKKSGGYGTPGAGASSGINPNDVDWDQ